MHTDEIIKDIRDLIHDVDQAYWRTFQARAEVKGLVDASNALDRAKEDLLNLEEMLRTLISNIEMETLSHKVQSK